MMMMNTIVSWYIEGDDETAPTIPPAIFLSKPPSEITLGYIKRFYHGPKGVFLVKTLEEDDMSSLIIGDGPQEERFHWSVMYDDELPVPQCSVGGIMIKVRPLPIGTFESLFQLTFQTRRRKNRNRFLMVKIYISKSMRLQV